MIRIGFIGTGSFARQHAEVLKNLGADITACYGTNPEKTAAFASDFQCKSYSEPDAMISPDIIDALYIVVPPFAHNGKVELRAIEQGIPFLCEKPIGLDLSICQEVAKKVEETDLITSSGFLLRHEPLFSEVKKIIERNKISTIRICSYSYMPEVHWWRKTGLSGGMMVESGSHYIDLLRYLFGEVISVASFSSEGIANNIVAECDGYDSMESIIKFNSGCIASIGVTHLLNRVNARNDMLEVYGQDFALKVDLYQLRYLNNAVALYKELNDADWHSIANQTDKSDLLRRESMAFINAIQQKNPSLIDSSYPDALLSLKVVLAMNQSSVLSQFVTV